MFRRMLALCIAGLLLLPAAAALAEVTKAATEPPAATAEPAATEEPTAADGSAETADADSADTEEVIEDYVDDDGMSEIVGEADYVPPIIDGLTPLYTTKVKFLTSTGYTATIRADQDQDSEALGYVNKGEIVTIYKVYPAWVLIEHEGVAGFILRTCIDENVTVLDPENTPPYGVTMMSYVATLTEDTKVYVDPDTESEAFAIEPGAGSKVAIFGFENGFAKVLYWRSYGYIDASVLTDLVVVSATDEPMSEDTPIAAFSSFFAYNTGTEMNDGRVKNIVRSCESMTRVMAPGESLNFNEQVGPYKKDNGYFPAPVLINGEAVPGYGGGTCQSSSTLYNTVRQLPGITIVYRRPHGPACARYLPMHQDAAVGSDTLNFIFRNDYDFSIRILAECTGEGILTIQIFKVEE